jgi:hypothetical protein
LAGGIALISVIIVARLWKPNLLKLGTLSSNSEAVSSAIEKLDKRDAHQSKKVLILVSIYSIFYKACKR